MIAYLDSLNDEIKEYFSILSPVFPEWLIDSILMNIKGSLMVLKNGHQLNKTI